MVTRTINGEKYTTKEIYSSRTEAIANRDLTQSQGVESAYRKIGNEYHVLVKRND